MTMSHCSYSLARVILLALCVVSAYELENSGGEMWTDSHLSSQVDEPGHMPLVSAHGGRRRLEFPNDLNVWLRRHSRRLTIGDFQDLDELYKDTSIPLPNQTLDGKLLGITWTVDIMDLQCQNLSIGDLEVNYARESDQLLAITLGAVQLDFNCYLDYHYKYMFFSGSGRADATTDNNSANITVAFTSTDFNQDGPTGFAVQSCLAGFNIADLNFHGGIVSRLLNVVEPLLRNFVKQKTEEFACQALSNLNKTATQLLQSVSNALEPYLNETALNETLASEAVLLQNATNVTLLSYQDPNGTLASAVDLLIRKAGLFLGSQSSDSNNSSGDLNVNDLIRSYVLDDDRSLTLKASSLSGLFDNGTLLDGGGAFTQTSLRFEWARIIGLDTFTRFEFASVDNHTLQASFTLESISLVASLLWEIQPPEPTSASPNITENLTVQLDLGQINVTANLLAAIDQKLLGSLPLGALLNSSEILNCLLSIFYETDIMSLDVAVEDIGLPLVSGFQSSPGLARITNITLNAVYDMYHAVLLKALPGFFQTTVRTTVSKIVHERLQQSFCPMPTLSNSTNKLIDLRDLLLPPNVSLALGGSGTSPYGGLASFIKGFIDSQLLSVNSATGLPRINDVLIAPLSKGQSGVEGTFHYKGDLLSLDRTVRADALLAKIKFKVNDARVENFVISEPLSLLDPVISNPYVLNNTAAFGTNSTQPLQLRANVLFNLLGDGGFEIKDEVALGISIYEAEVLATALLELSEAKFLGFPLSDMFNLHCWLATIPAPVLNAHGVRDAGTEPTAGLKALNVSSRKVGFNVSCLNCTGESVLQALSANLEKAQGSGDASLSAKNLIRYATKILGGGFLQVRLDRMIAQAPTKCPHSPAYNPNAASLQYEPFPSDSKKSSIGFLVALLVATGCICVLAFIVSQLVRSIVRRRHRKWLRNLPPDHVLIIYRQQALEQRNEKQLNRSAHSMFQSPAIPCFMRWAIPVVLVANIGLFVSGHLSIAGSVSIRAEFAGQVLVVDDFYKFSIVQSAIELWEAGGKVLAVLIFLFSGVWPYTKQVTTLAMWFLPPRLLPLSRRGCIFGWLDLLAKWSIIDVFFMILSLVAFRVTIASPRLSYLPPDFYKVDLLVIPLWGLYANLIAQLLSQVSAHFVVHYHRCTVLAAKRDMDRQTQAPRTGSDNGFEQPSQHGETHTACANDEQQVSERLRDHAFMRPHRGETDKLEVRSWVPSLLCLAAFVAASLVTLGCALASLSFEAQGVVGVLVNAGHGFQKSSNYNSVFSMAQLLMEEAQLLDTAKAYVGILSIVVLFILTTFVVPLIQSVLLVAQFLLPLATVTRNKIAVAIEILQDWQYVDVYVISILVTTSQLGNVSQYLVNPYCESVQDTLSSLAFYGILKSEDAQCFRIQAGISSGTYVLLAAAVVLTILHTFVTKALAQYRRDKTNNRELAEVDRIYSSSDDEEIAKAIERIHPVPVLFTDNFRWVLQRTIPRTPKTRHEETFDEETEFAERTSANLEENNSM